MDSLKTGSSKRKFTFSKFIKLFIKLNKEFKTNDSDSFSFNIILLYFYFSHLMSYVIFYDSHSEEDQKFHILNNIIFFSNHVNIIIYIENVQISIIVYSITVSLIFFISLYVPFLIFGEIIWKKGFGETKLVSFFNYLFVFLLNAFYWCLLQPSLDLMFKAALCEEESPHSFKNKMICFGNQFLIIFISILSVLLMLFFAVLNLLLNDNFLFLERMSLNFNRIKIIQLVLFGLRVIITLLSVLHYDSKSIIHLAIHMFFLFSIVDYFQFLPFRNPHYNKFYFGLLCCCELFTFLLSSFEFYFLLTLKSFFFSFFPLSLLLFKLSSLIYQRKNNLQYFSLTKNNTNNNYVQEEILNLFDKENSSQQCHFILIGLLRKISKGKEKIHIELRNSIFNNQYHNLSSRDRFKILSNYVKESFQNMIYSNIKNNKGKRELEISILKYISFLLKGNATALKTFFEYLKIKSMITNSSSLFKIKSNILFDEIVLKIDQIQSEIKKSNKNISMDESTILASDFFHLEKKRKALLRKMNDTILSKMDFYEKLNNGFESYDEMLSKLSSSARRIQDLKHHLEKTPDIISLKFYSIFNCIILNLLPLAEKNEDEVENIKKRYYKNENDKLTPNLIFSSSIAIFQISFLSKNEILESSKTESLANFFGFSRSELTSLNNINLLMPKFIANIHRKIIENSFEKNRKTSNKDNISVLAINKQGFCFPVQIFFSNCFEFDDDFVLNTLIRRRNSHQKHIVLADSDCLIANVSEETFSFLNSCIFNLTPSDLNFFKLYHLIPETKQLLTEESFDQLSKKVIQKEGVVLIPEFIDEIIELLRIKRQILYFQQENSKNNLSVSSFKSMKSLHSENKRRGCDKLLLDFLSRNTYFCHKFEGRLMEWMKNNNLQASDLLENFYSLSNLREFKIVFNLEIKIVYLDETNTKTNSLQYIELYIDKLEEEIKDGSIISGSKINVFGIPTYRNTMMNVNFPDLKMEANHNVNFEASKSFIEGDHRNILNTVTNNKLNVNEEVKISFESKSDEKDPEDRKSSNYASSSIGLGSLRTSLIEILKNLMNSLPFSVSIMFFLLIIQLTLVFLFALLIFLLSNNYLHNYYYLLHETMIDQSTLNLAYRYAGVIIIQNELELNGFIKRDDFTKKKQSEILENMSSTTKAVLNKFRDHDRGFLYEQNLKRYMTKSLDLRTEKIRNITFSDLMDSLLENMNYFINRSSSNDSTVMKFFGRNMPYYLEGSKVNRDLGQLEFLDSKQLISSQLINVLVAISLFIFTVKIIESLHFIKLQRKLVQLLNIPLRITQHESRKELLFLREIISKAKSVVFPFISLSFTEHLLKKDEIYESEKKLNVWVDNRLSSSKKKKERNLSIQPFSKKSLWAYLALSLILFCSYGTVNYVFIIDTQDKITNLINFNVMTNNLNMYTGNIVGNTLFQIRDKLLMEKEYDKLKEDLQNLKFRQTFYYNRTTGRIADLKLYIHAIPSQYTEAKADLDNNFDELVNGDVCRELINRAELEEDWKFFCRKALNGGFNRGIIGALNEYLNFVNQIQDYVKPRNNDDASVVLKENQKIIKLFNESDYKNIVLESHILVKSLRVFLNVMKDYYNDTLNKKITTLEIIIFVSCFMTFVMLAVFLSLWMKKNRAAYRDCVWGLGLIPYEKIVNDEQTNFLIKQFNKEV